MIWETERTDTDSTDTENVLHEWNLFKTLCCIVLLVGWSCSSLVWHQDKLIMSECRERSRASHDYDSWGWNSGSKLSEQFLEGSKNHTSLSVWRGRIKPILSLLYSSHQGCLTGWDPGFLTMALKYWRNICPCSRRGFVKWRNPRSW
jgi:hypothetical protein